MSPAHDLAWDCATGSGQAAVGLAPHFARVVASDGSAEQLEHAMPTSNVEYRCFPAEAADLDASSVDLVTVAQALHWFDTDRFYDEVRRVLRPAGVIAAWTYGRSAVADAPDITAITDEFHDRIVGPYWPPGREHVDSGYVDLPFPFARIDAPTFAIRAHWTLAQLLDYFGTWSSVVRYRTDRGTDPRDVIAPALTAAWGDPSQAREIVWPLTILAGRVSPW